MTCTLVFVLASEQPNRKFQITFYLEESFCNDDLVCRESLLDDMLRETDEVLIRRQRIQETLQVLEQAHRVFTPLLDVLVNLCVEHPFDVCIFSDA